jgi:pimeloyl-ACP methyl ester carboxylesterase
MLVACTLCVLLALWLRVRKDTVQTDRDPRRRLSVTVMLSVMLGPVMYSLATSALFLIFAAVSRVYPTSAKTWTGGAPRCPGDTFVEPFDPNCPDGLAGTTVDWGLEVVRAAIQPLGLALLLVGGLTSLIAIFARPYLTTFRRRNAHANAYDVAHRQGRAFSRMLRLSGADGVFVFCVGIVVVVTAAAAVVWLGGDPHIQDVGDFLASVALPMAFGLALLAIAGIGLRNVGFVGRFGGGFITSLGLVLDMIYDVTSYLRVANPAIVAPRVQMIARFRAVLKHARTLGYEHVVVMAHSQGTVLTLATLLGDPDRAPAVARPAADDIPARLTFLSYGSPATQTYARRFPGQFDQWPSEAVSATSPIGAWLNVYRAGDFIGRWIQTPADDPGTEDLPPLRERCLGQGHHTLYPRDERWRRIARHVVISPSGTVQLADVSLADLTVTSLDQPPELSSEEAPARS